MEVKINKEIRDYTEAIFFGLSLRQFIFSGLACGIAVGLYFLLHPYMSMETVSWICVLGAAPCVVFGFVKYHGMTAEQFIWAWIKSEILMPKKHKAIMMQESGGRGLDPMQCSEGSFNTKYPRQPNGITDPEYSISCGVQEIKSCLERAGVKNPLDMENIKLALQSYNYGNGYLEWAKARGGYTLANAAEFSDMMAQRMGWSSYGDKQYVPHVLQYYAFGRIPTGIGNQAIVQVAASQEGKGGTTYWSWYGFGSRVEWCACFVSWCADQSGYIQSGAIPKFSLCSDGVKWFESKGRFRDASYTPAAGDIIFFDWGNNGTIDHVGIVESVSGGTVNTIEGNSGDKVARRSYSIGSSNIYGYGVPAY